MLHFTGLIPAFGKWYSYDQSLRLQVQAFMRGELALQAVPYGHRHDWAWGNGIQQVWGLGVPLIQLPFEFFSRLFGLFGFPDRIIFLIFYALVALIFWNSLDSATDRAISDTEWLEKRIQSIPVLFLGFLSPAFITMMQAKLGPYEEVIAYGYLWAFMLFALMRLFMNNPKTYLYLLICLLSGFSPNLRPTTGAYGIATFLTVFFLAGRSRTRFRWIGPPVFMAGILFLLATNYLRFGSPVEFGHKLLLTSAPVVDYILKFDNPITWVQFTDAALELFSALFFLDLSSNEPLIWYSNVPRMLEFNFKPYNSVTLALLLFAWLLGALNFLQGKVQEKFSGIRYEGYVQMALIWSFCSFVILFFFYSRTPALASRYLIDFAPAIFVGIGGLFLFLAQIIRSKLPESLAPALIFISSSLIIGWIFLGIYRSEIIPMYQHLSEVELKNVTSAKIARAKLDSMRRTSGPPLPEIYFCGDRNNFDIPYNNAGWRQGTDCSVGLVTTHFLNNPSCVGIYIEPLNIGMSNYSDREIEVKSGLERLNRTSEVKYGQGKIITYCTKEERENKNTADEQFNLISIAWINLRKHPDFSSPPVSLISLGKIR